MLSDVIVHFLHSNQSRLAVESLKDKVRSTIIKVNSTKE